MLVGFSRKSTLRASSSGAIKVGTTAVSVGAAVSAYERGATILRVHDVREHVEALAAAKAVRGSDRRAASASRSSATTAPTRRSRRDGQLFLFDVELEVGERGADDRLDERDRLHARSPRPIRELSDGRRFDLLEALATAVADLLYERFAPERVRVRVRKPGKPAGLTVEYSAGDRRAAVTIAYVGLGSNLGDREATIRRAAELIGAARLSTLIETEPWGYVDQPRFLNAVAEVETTRCRRALL